MNFHRSVSRQHGVREAIIANLLMIGLHCLASAATRTVVLSDTQLPGLPPGASFNSSINGYSLNSAGQVSVVGLLGLPDGSAVAVSETTGSLQVVARSGQSAPGSQSGVFENIGEISADASGRISFSAVLAGTVATSNSGIWTENGGTLRAIVVEGSDAPGTAVGAKFGNFTLHGTSYSSNEAGQIVFPAQLQQGSGGVTNSNDRGIWIDNGGLLSLVAREASPAPDVAPGGTFATIRAAQINQSGQIVFPADLQPGTGDVTVDSQFGLWDGNPGAPELVARQGQHLPGTPDEHLLHHFYTYAIGDGGHVVFTAELGPFGVITIDNFNGIWSGKKNDLHLVARRGDHAPGTPAGAVYGGSGNSGSGFYPPAINIHGDVAFQSDLRVGLGGVNLSNDSAIWVEKSGIVQLVVREGDFAPGVPGGFFHDFIEPAAPLFNNSGHIAFSAVLSSSNGAVSNANNRGIWAQDPLGTLTLVARTGDLVDVDDGPGVDLRTISLLLLRSGSTGQSGTPNTFNDAGQLAFEARFTDGTQGVFLWSPNNVPEPSTISVLLIGTTGLIRLRRPHRPLPN
jgi:hypothetical protein